MSDNEVTGLKRPDRQGESSGDHEATRCPECGGALVSIATRGPGVHHVGPCGCRVGVSTVRDLAGGAVR